MSCEGTKVSSAESMQYALMHCFWPSFVAVLHFCRLYEVCADAGSILCLLMLSQLLCCLCFFTFLLLNPSP